MNALAERFCLFAVVLVPAEPVKRGQEGDEMMEDRSSELQSADVLFDSSKN